MVLRAVRALGAWALFLCLLATAASGCGSSSPAAPAPTNSARVTGLAIGGQTILGVGVTSQLSARAIDGTTPNDVTWISATPAVATVSSGGLITTHAVGATTITATAPSVDGIGSVTVLVQPSGGSVLTACTNITTAGHYIVDRDLGNTSPCVSIANVSNVQLDCQGHSMRAIVLDHASHTTLTNCVVNANIKMTAVDDVTVSGSTIGNGILWAVQSTNVVFTGNTLRNTLTGLGGLIVLDSGSNNRVMHNTLTGGYDGSRGNVGADDWIILYNESGDDVESNSISNVFDAGIEGVGALTGTRLINNTMTNLGVTGVASYWCTAWTNTTVQGNSVMAAPLLVRIIYETGSLCNGPIVPAAFSANQFIGNVLRNPSPGTSPFPVPAAISIGMPGSVQDNLIQMNDVGSVFGIFLSPSAGFINGGGNVCGSGTGLSTFIC
jgi:hypothetical protein